MKRKFGTPSWKLMSNLAPVYDLHEIDNPLSDSIISETPFLCGKIGGTEAFVMRTIEFKNKNNYSKACEQLCMWSGFFPNDYQLLGRYAELMRNSISEVDLLEGSYTEGVEYFIKKYCKELKGISNELMYNEKHPWTYALKGKRVLVIHPFEDSIRKQYTKREHLFDNPEVLPEFELLTIKAVQTIADEVDDRFKDWFEALDYMCTQIDQMEFDVALIGCGAYGLPLGAYVKNKGKVAVHMGGGLQLLFGIWGSRWDSDPIFREMRNQYWILPSDEERPKGMEKVENACYW
jgi:hypothetical protein